MCLIYFSKEKNAKKLNCGVKKRCKKPPQKIKTKIKSSRKKYKPQKIKPSRKKYKPPHKENRGVKKTPTKI